MGYHEQRVNLKGRSEKLTMTLRPLRALENIKERFFSLDHLYFFSETCLSKRVEFLKMRGLRVRGQLIAASGPLPT